MNSLNHALSFFEYLVDGDGIHTVNSKITAVKEFPTPKSVENVCSFLGLAGYYRAFVKNFASIASPLARLLKKDIPFLWNDTQQQSFNTLKDVLSHAPILAFPDYSLPFALCTDDSSLVIGAVLMQTEENKRPHIIAYASRVLTAAVSKYSVTHLEALAVVWALKHFRDIIFVYPITVYADHTAVTQLFHGKTLQDVLLDGILLSNSLNQHLTICPAKPTQLQMLYPATFQIMQSTRLLTFPYLNYPVLNAKTSYGPKSSMP